MDTVFTIINLVLNILILAIFARAILSWFLPLGRDPFTRILIDVTEPVLAPIRSVLSRLLPLPIDLSPIVAWLLILFLQKLIGQAHPGF